MNSLLAFFENFIALSADASPWLLLGLLIAGLMKAWVPSQILCKHLGTGNKAIIKAALIGAPLPLCSCGVIPVAKELHNSGASDAATSAFLVATPETGIDSISVSYAMLGPFFAIYRPITAIFSAIVTGLLVANIKNTSVATTSNKKNNVAEVSSCCASIKTPTCCDDTPKQPTTCCGESTKKIQESCCSSSSTANKNSFVQKNLSGIRYACTQLIDDIIIWLLIGLVFASLVQTFIPPSFLLSYGSGLPAMLMMILISIPMYICATASTPIAAGFILAGLSPGTALVFMMAGPATNISTLGVVKKTMGTAVLVRYLVGISACAIGFGLLLDWGVSQFNIDISQQMQHSHTLIPFEIGAFCGILLLFLSIKPLRKICL